MANFKTKGIIIAENNMGDFDKMVTMLTPNGKIGCAAKGARRPKSQLMAGTQFLCFGEYMLFKGSNTYTLNSCETIEIFYNIRTDIDKLEYTAEITKLIQEVTDENQNTYKILQLYLNTLYVISETDMNLDLAVSIFKIRLMCLLGFTPRIDKCVNCLLSDSSNSNEGNSDNISNKLQYFSFIDNGFKCTNCARQDTGAFQISESTKNAIKYIVMAPAKKIFSFSISEENVKQLKLVAKVYTENQLN